MHSHGKERSRVSDRTDFDVLIPFVEYLGLRMLEKGGGSARVGFDPRPEHMNSWQAIHGGGVMTLLDAALSSACRSLDDDCIGATTVEMKVNFLAPARGPVIAEGRAQRAGRSLLFAEGELRDGGGTVVAKATGTFKLVYPQARGE
jgi:uncharacterized protein (TIGR00369 family)